MSKAATLSHGIGKKPSRLVDGAPSGGNARRSVETDQNPALPACYKVAGFLHVRLSCGISSNFREVAAEAGPIYRYKRLGRVVPYGKFLFGYGGIDFRFVGAGNYTHDTRNITAPGGGFEYRAFRNLWVRADYEYQFWPDLFGRTSLNPQGFTAGAMCNFRRLR